ncbi:hypothetical protein PHLGIDRAFT_376376 [Phlebiopsis gigantea 11061_1 CR5-6]|uniref:Ubiquitin 3 binding protein But2 C-terminal domain-containing protein n=1 Tax=Phlebiopsis gigantea (strain 11061_1 CR5-6) TaxID=745531 RepID=A0A0C3SC64_PHLG1|nr:hypothetical protein PHLGIDRAFT_376376 [Phlebiopsis gigantea 11061_1 CR5-6]
MRLSHFTLLAAAVGALASPAKRQGGGTPVTILSPGSIVTPTDGITEAAEDSFPFSVAVPEFNHCHPGYTPVDVYLLETQPTVDSLNSTHQFTDYLYFFGSYLVNNFPGELPNMGTPPPSSLTMPDLGLVADTPVYLATMETIEGCPPNGFFEYAIDSKSITFSG